MPVEAPPDASIPGDSQGSVAVQVGDDDLGTLLGISQADSLPIPEPPPVTMATLPSSLMVHPFIVSPG